MTTNQLKTVVWQFYQELGGKWFNGGDNIKDHKKNTIAAGFLVRDLCVAHHRG